MHPAIERLKEWKSTTLRNLKQRSWKAWFIVVAGGYIILEIVRAYLTDAGKLLFVWVLDGGVWLMQQRMGVGGLALVGYLAILAGISWVQSRPRSQQLRPDTPPLPETERRLVQDLRTVWKRHGVLAVSQVHGILSDAASELGRREFWGELLRPIPEALNTHQTTFESVLEPDRSARIAEVRQSFNQLYTAYISAMKWVAILQGRDLLFVGRSTQRLQVWRQNHRDLVNRLQDLDQDPEHNGTLKIYLNWIDDPIFRLFLREAEMAPEWLALIQESEVRAVPVESDASE
jgi:hypothetical protein